MIDEGMVLAAACSGYGGVAEACSRCASATHRLQMSNDIDLNDLFKPCTAPSSGTAVMPRR